MTRDRDVSELRRDLEGILDRIDSAGPAGRTALLAQLDRAIDLLEAAGETVPPRVHAIHEARVDEEIEAQFDNLPV